MDPKETLGAMVQLFFKTTGYCSFFLRDSDLED